MADRDALEARLLIDGARVPAASGATVPVDYPATGTVLAYVAQAGVEDAHAAIEPARRSYEEGSWRRAAVAARACCCGWPS